MRHVIAEVSVGRGDAPKSCPSDKHNGVKRTKDIRKGLLDERRGGSIPAPPEYLLVQKGKDIDADEEWLGAITEAARFVPIFVPIEEDRPEFRASGPPAIVQITRSPERGE